MIWCGITTFENRKRCGSRCIQRALAKTGVRIGRWKVRRMLSEENLKAIRAKAYKPKTIDSCGIVVAPNLLAEINIRECAAAKIIIGDITYIRLRGGKFCYLAVSQDKVTRRIIGWSLAETLEAEIVISALIKAVEKGFIKAGAIIHSDRGSQYASNGFRELLRVEGFHQSMSGRSNCYNNAQADSFLLAFQVGTPRRRSVRGHQPSPH